MRHGRDGFTHRSPAGVADCYKVMAQGLPVPEWAFMNYGFVPEPGTPTLTLDRADEPDRLCIQLYDHVIGSAELSGRDVLEVGSGRGGGASYLSRYRSPRSVTGVDLAARSIELSLATPPGRGTPVRPRCRLVPAVPGPLLRRGGQRGVVSLLSLDGRFRRGGHASAATRRDVRVRRLPPRAADPGPAGPAVGGPYSSKPPRTSPAASSLRYEPTTTGRPG